MKEIIVSILSLILATGIAGGVVAPAVGGTGISQLDQWTSTTTPSLAITQAVFGKDIRLTGYENLDCIGTNSSGMLEAGTCTGGGGGGSGTIGTSTDLVSGQVVVSTGVNTVGNDSAFLWDFVLNKLTVTNASTTDLSVSSVTSALVLTNAAGTLLEYAGSACGSNTFAISISVVGAVTCAAVDLANAVTGILPVSNGGTGWANIQAGALVYGNGTGRVATTTQGTGGQVLAWLGGIPTWTATTTFSGGLTYSGGNVTSDLGTSITVGELASADFGDWSCNGSTCTLDTAYVPQTRTITVAGTANQLTSSAGAQDLSANRTWTFSLPAHVIFPGNFFVNNSTTTNATTTAMDILNRLTFGGVTGTAWSDFCVSITGSADLCDGNDASGSGGSAFEIATTSDIAISQVAYITKTSGLTTLGSVATGTLSSANSALTVTGSRYVLGGGATLTISTTTTNMFTGTAGQVLAYTNTGWTGVATTTFSGGLTYSGGNVTNTMTAGDGITRNTDDLDCDIASGSVFGCLSTTDWTNFNGKISTSSYDLIRDWSVTTNLYSQSALAPTSTTRNIKIDATGTSTFAGGVEAWRQLAAPYFHATSTSKTSTFETPPTFTTLTSALILTGSGGLTAEYTGASNPCTNQVPTTISALGVLGGCLSINNSWWSGADLTVANGGTGLSTFGGTNTILYTTAADTLASEAAFLYDQATDKLTVVNATTTNMTATYASSTRAFFGTATVGTSTQSKPFEVWGNASGGIASFNRQSDGSAGNFLGTINIALQGLTADVDNSGPAFTLDYIPFGTLTRNTLASIGAYRTGNNTTGELALQVANTGASAEIVRVRNNTLGAVGIGTSTPRGALNVNSFAGAMKFPQLTISDTSLGSDLKHWFASTTAATGNLVIGTMNDAFTTLTSRFTFTRAGSLGVGTTTPDGRLSVTGDGTALTRALRIANSAETPLLTVQNNGTTTISGITAATSTTYCFSTGASKGCEIIMEDIDGAGCTKLYALNGTLSAEIATCPVEN